MTGSPTRTYAVEMTIPDNEAFTAGVALNRLGIPVARVHRLDIWSFTVDPREVEALDAVVSSLETIFNPNKHRLTIRATDSPEPGEVWVMARDETPATTVAGRSLPGVRAIHRRTAWRLLDDAGNDLDDALLARASETFLCNPAFQEATR